ncbi:MAG: hypothetical protein HQ561_18455, partial [Desulfobacteraceae bacterium]|nr:hypothetical protein [Desulfobacteraceae bacterium]
MRDSKLIFLVFSLLLSAFLTPGLDGVAIFPGPTIASGEMAADKEGPWLSEISEVLGCYCGCDLTLSECKRDDPDCKERPAILAKLPSIATSGGAALLELGGCTCGCGYRLVECEVKHKACTQRPVIHQQLKRLAIKYGYDKTYKNNKKLNISPGEREMFSEAQNRRSSLLYVYGEKGGKNSTYLKELQEFQKEFKERLALIPLSLADKGETSLLKYYRIQGPSVVMVEPNGAVSAFLQGEPPIKNLRRGLVSPKMAEVLLAIQQGKTIFLAVGPPGGKAYEDTRQTLVPAVQKLGGIATDVWLDPGDASEKPLLSALKYEKGSRKGVPVFV